MHKLHHRLLLLKLDKQIGGTIYQPTPQRTMLVHLSHGGGGVQRWKGWGAMLEGVGYSKHASFMNHYSKGTYKLK